MSSMPAQEEGKKSGYYWGITKKLDDDDDLLSSPPLLSNSMPGSPTPSSLAAAGRRRLPGTRSGDGVTGSGWPLGGSALACAVAAGPTPWPRWSLRRRRHACGAAVPRVAGCRSGAPPLAPAWPAGGPPSPPTDEGDQVASALNQGVEVAEAIRKTPLGPANLWAILGVSWSVGLALFVVQWSVLRGGAR